MQTSSPNLPAPSVSSTSIDQDALSLASSEEFERQTSTRKQFFWGLGVLFLFIASLFVWSFAAPLASAVVASGKIAIEGRTKAVQHQTGGTVDAIHATNGDEVREGQVVVQLDIGQERSLLEGLRSTYDALKAREARLVAERDGLEKPNFDASLVDSGRKSAALAMQAEDALLRIRRQKNETEQRAYAAKSEQLGSEIQAAVAMLQSINDNLDLIQADLDAAGTLAKKGVVAPARIRELQREHSRYLGEQGRYTAKIAQAKHEIAELELLQLEKEVEFISEVSTNLAEVNLELSELLPKIEVSERKIADASIRAPVTGTIFGMNIFTPGQVIQPGQTILQIVPTEGELVIEAYIKPEDVERVTEGLSSSLRIIGVARRRDPEFSGIVRNVSADRLIDEASNKPFYLSYIGITDKEKAISHDIRLYPGMPVQVFINTQTRTLFDYLMDPVNDALLNSIREE